MRELVTTMALVLAIAPFAHGQQPATKVDFSHDVVPILKAKCIACHANGTYKGGISFDTRETLLKAKAAVPGKSAESEIVKRVASKDAEMLMPPKGDALSEKEV